MAKSQPIRIRVFPNTGHQYTEIPLADLMPDKDADFLRTFARRNRRAWAKVSEYTPWILFQYGGDSEQSPCLKLAIESNLGLNSRGLLFGVDPEPVDELPDEDDITSTYACADEAEIESIYRDRLIPIKLLPTHENKQIEVNIEIFWPRMGGYSPVDVDLIVDLGNTRSVVLLLESPGQNPQDQPLSKRVHSLHFTPRGTPYSATTQNAKSPINDTAIIDSWMLLHQTLFHHLEPPATTAKLNTSFQPIDGPAAQHVRYQRRQYLPHTFVELSPALVGGGRASAESAFKIFAGVSLDTDARFYLSSPKRYAWDDDPQGILGGTFWRQIPNSGGDNPPDVFNQLGGLIRYFMDPRKADRDIDNPPDPDDFRGLPYRDSPPSYPRSDAICWYALTVLETAYRQINSPEHLRTAGRESLPRRLRAVRVTYPAGWTCAEREAYFDQWRRAINLFTMTRFEDHRPVSLRAPENGGSRPILANPPIDEAVASQLPLIYSDIQSLGSPAAWLSLFGSNDQVTVMNLDIGGGTSDLSIMRYSSEFNGSADAQRGNVIQSELIFRDGYSIAGDQLVKRIIEKQLLPKWLEASGLDQFDGIPEARKWIARFFKKPDHKEFQQIDPKASQKMARIVRLVLVPLVNLWLERYSDTNPDAPWEHLSVADCMQEGISDKNVLIELNQMITQVIRMKTRRGQGWNGTAFRSDSDVMISCDRADIDTCIDEVFGKFFDALGGTVGRFNCNLVIVSGKPSELPRIRERILQSFPIMPQRIIHVKNFPAGDWYPFSTFHDGRISDAKTCTVVGAAMYQDMSNNNQSDFIIRDVSMVRAPRQCYWGIIPKNNLWQDFHKNYLFTPADYPTEATTALSSPPKEVQLPIPCRIGRQTVRMPDVRPDPVYELRFRPTSNMAADSGVSGIATLKWTSSTERGEELSLVRVKPAPGSPNFNPDDVQLRLNTMLETSHWLDEPSFDSQYIYAENSE